MSHPQAWVRGGALLLALGFLALLVRSQWQLLVTFDWQWQPGWLLASLALLQATWLLELSIWRFLLSRLGGRLPWGRAAQAWFIANLMRYIPGNIWQFVGLMELAADDGVSRVAGFTSIALHQLLSTLVGLALAAVYLAVAGQGAWLDAIRPALWLLPLGLLLCHPRLLQWGMNWLLQLLKRPLVQVTLTWQEIWLALAGYAVVWLLMGGSFALLANAITPLAASQWIAWVAVWAAAYTLGYLALLAPNGLGVREGVMVLLLGSLIAAPLPTIVALAARLWLAVGELLGAGIALTTRFFSTARCKGGAPNQRAVRQVHGNSGDHLATTPATASSGDRELA